MHIPISPSNEGLIGRAGTPIVAAIVFVEQAQLIAMLVAACSGWAVIRIARKMSFEGVGFSDGGGYTALLIAGVMINLAGVSVALS